MEAVESNLAPMLPLDAGVSPDGHLILGGADVAELAARFGTPLYVYDEATIRAACQAYVAAFTRERPANGVHYAAKAYLAPWLCRVLHDEGLGLDVVSGGELHIALTAGIPAAEIRLHGNNKLSGELRDAVAAGVGRIVVDNLDELRLLTEVAADVGRKVAILLRLTPDVAMHTHAYMHTGLIDSKFGLPIASGEALDAVRRALQEPALELRGYHAHVGSNAQEPDPIAEGARQLLAFARTAREATGYWPAELSPGGGLGIAYTRGACAPDPHTLAQAVFAALAGADPLPAVSVEPGRSIIGRAGVAIYTVGVQKQIPGVRHYVAVDGGMADNIRPALYGAQYTPLAATRMHTTPAGVVTIAGRYCESGDVLARDVALPRLHAGDLLAIPAAGAYCLPMSSAYNAALRPAVVVVAGGTPRLVGRRGTLDDLLAYEVHQI